MIGFIPLQENHFPLLLKWLQEPHVKAWWDQNTVWTMDLIRKKYGTYVKGYKLENTLRKSLKAYIICLDHHEVGYIQFYNAYDFPREGPPLQDLPSSLAALDIFIGNPSYVGRGYGAKIMDQFLHNYIDPNFEACFVDPDSRNLQAIKAYEKIRFRKVKTINNGTILWMVRERAT